MKTKSSIRFFLMNGARSCARSCALSCAMISVLVWGSQKVFAAPIEFNQLAQEEQNQVKNRSQVSRFTPVEGESWPECNIYQYVHATPEEAAAVFSDFNRQSQYIPAMTHSEIIKVIDSVTMDVSYQVQPSFAGIKKTENYTTKDHLMKGPMPGSFQIAWYLVKADSTKISNGYARFEPMGSGTLLTYYSLVETTQWGASLPFVVSGVKDQVKDAISKIALHIENVKMNDPKLLQTEMDTFKNALDL